MTAEPTFAVLPAYCRTCNRLVHSGFAVGAGSHGNTFENCGTTCPRCGNEANIPDGTYDFVGGVLKIIGSTDASREQLSAIAAILGRAVGESRSHAEIQSEIEAQAPAYKELAKLLPKDSAARAAWIMVVLEVIKLLLGVYQTPTQPIINIDRRVVIEASASTTKATTGRNSPCPCGSGKKYKHCHGAVAH